MTLSHNKRLALTGLFAAMTVSLGVFETFIALPVPGVRLGVSNVGIMLAIYLIDLPAGIYIAIAKSILVPLLTGNLIVKMSIGLPATICSTVAMGAFLYLLKKHTTPLSTGAVGACTHILIQFVVVKNLYIKTDAIYKLLPYFTLFSVVTGVVTGYITLIILKNLYGDDRCTSCFKK